MVLGFECSPICRHLTKEVRCNGTAEGERWNKLLTPQSTGRDIQVKIKLGHTHTHQHTHTKVESAPLERDEAEEDGKRAAVPAASLKEKSSSSTPTFMYRSKENWTSSSLYRKQM